VTNSSHPSTICRSSSPSTVAVFATRSPPRDNGVIYDYANRRHIPIVTGDDTTNGIGPGAHREDLYAGLFSKAAETTTNQESRLAVVERIWLDSLNATIKPGSFDLTSNDQGFHQKASRRRYLVRSAELRSEGRCC